MGGRDPEWGQACTRHLEGDQGALVAGHEIAAASLKLTAEDAKSLGVIERILSENDIGRKEFYDRIRALLAEEIKTLSGDVDLTQNRYDRFRSLGVSAVLKE